MENTYIVFLSRKCHEEGNYEEGKRVKTVSSLPEHGDFGDKPI